MLVSVIITTYNQPRWLEHVLWSYSIQSYWDFELCIADDGSTGETTRVIEKMRAETGLPIHHFRHEDRGFRKCVILNRAIERASGEYLVFSDGDCIVRPDFVQQHVRLARRRRFLSGGTARLPRRLSHAIQREDVLSGNVHSVRWLLMNGMSINKKLRMLLGGEHVSRLLDTLLTTRPTFNGHNASAWREDVMRANGFDERMQYGGLDRELGERLTNAGVRGKQIRNRVPCVHLAHERGYETGQSWIRNREIRGETRRRRLTWTPCGIQQEPLIIQFPTDRDSKSVATLANLKGAA